MYNRYVPGTNGVYECHSVPEPILHRIPDVKHDPSHPKNRPVEVQESNLASQTNRMTHGMDLEDLLILCIIFLILVDAEQEDISSILITAAAFLFLQ